MKPLFMLGALALAAGIASPAIANDRYLERPPVVVSPDLSAPWVMQLGREPGKIVSSQAPKAMPVSLQVQPFALEPRFDHRYDMPNPQQQQQAQPVPQQRTGIFAMSQGKTTQGNKRQARQMDPIYLPQEVAFDGPQKPGTIVIDTKKNFLYLVEQDGKARRYGVGTGKPGFEWAGTHKISQKREWPDWRPPSEMIARERARGRVLPAYLEGGLENPLGARAMYLGSSLYRIHGTNQPWTIGGAVSSGCIRMRNEDVIDLYERVKVGATVVVS